MAENMKEELIIKEEFKGEIKEEAFEKEEFFLSFSSEEIFTVDVQREDANIENKGETFWGVNYDIKTEFSFPHSSEICQRKGISVKFILLLLNFPQGLKIYQKQKAILLTGKW